MLEKQVQAVTMTFSSRTRTWTTDFRFSTKTILEKFIVIPMQFPEKFLVIPMQFPEKFLGDEPHEPARTRGKWETSFGNEMYGSSKNLRRAAARQDLS
jgi:hypothetical protein